MIEEYTAVEEAFSPTADPLPHHVPGGVTQLHFEHTNEPGSVFNGAAHKLPTADDCDAIRVIC